MLRPLALLPLCVLAACTQLRPQGSTPYQPSTGMLQVLAEWQAMHAKERSSLSLAEARDVPTLTDAAHAIPNVVGLPSPTIEVSQFNQPTASGAEGPLSARLYRPALAKNTPAIIFFQGGTWATGNLDEADDTARQLAVRTGWVVVTVRTRLAPEAPFPAQHEDAIAAYQWARSQLRAWGADPTRVVLGGEGPGANLALATALRARDTALSPGRPVPVPDYLLLITPWAGTATGTPSMAENGDFPPLSRATVRWAQDLYAAHALADPAIDLAARTDFARMPPTLMILAEIDPLRSSAEGLAARMTAAGVPVQTRLYQGTTYEFFGLGAQVAEAAIAEADTARILQAHFARYQRPVITGPLRHHRSRRVRPARIRGS